MEVGPYFHVWRDISCHMGILNLTKKREVGYNVIYVERLLFTV